MREYQAKRILKAQFAKLLSIDLPILVAQANAGTDWAALRAACPWLSTSKLVVKPDMLFGQRGKHDLVGLNLDLAQAEAFIRERLGRSVTVNGCTGRGEG